MYPFPPHQGLPFVSMAFALQKEKIFVANVIRNCQKLAKSGQSKIIRLNESDNTKSSPQQKNFNINDKKKPKKADKVRKQYLC